MSLEKHIEKFGKEFVSIPVKDVRYWDALEMYIGNVTDCDKYHPIDSTIAFEFYDENENGQCIAYKPLSCFRRDK